MHGYPLDILVYTYIPYCLCTHALTYTGVCIVCGTCTHVPYVPPAGSGDRDNASAFMLLRMYMYIIQCILYVHVHVLYIDTG